MRRDEMPGDRIGRTVAEVRQHVSRGLAIAAVSWCACAVLALLAIAPLLSGDGGWRPGSPVPLLLVAAAAGVAAAAFVGWRRAGRRWGAEHRVTRAIDDVAGLHEGETLGSLQLFRAAPEGTSAGLRALAIRLVSERLVGGAKALSGKLGERSSAKARRASFALLAAVPVVSLAVAWDPARAFSAWGGLAHPLDVLAEPVLPPVSVEPGTAEVARGSVVEVVIDAPLRDSVWLRWDVTGQVSRVRTVVLADGAGRSSLPPVHAETRYRIEAPDGAESARHVLAPVDPLFVGAYSLQVSYPPHTRLPDDEYQDEVPPLVLPAGTRLRVQGRGSRTIGSGALVHESGQVALRFAVDGTSFSGSWVPARSGSYGWEFSDLAGGRPATVPEPLVLEVAADRRPEIEFVYPGPDTVLPVDLRQPLVVRVQDDYGVVRVDIVAQKVSVFGEAAEPAARGVDLGASTGAIIRPILDVSAWDLSPGDAIHYWARAVDNHSPGQSAETPVQILRMPNLADLERAAQEELSRAAEEVEALANEAERAGQQSRDVQARNEGDRDGERVGFEAREEVAQALEETERMMAAVDSLQRELAGLREALRDAGMADPELRDRIEGLEELLNDAVPEEERRALAEQLEQLAEMDERALRDALERMAADQEELRRRLEESVEQFRQAALEQDFNATSREAADLAEEQERLASAMEEGALDSLRAEQQAALEERAGELQAQLEQLQERLAEAGERSAGAVQDAGDRLSQARQQMAQAAQMASQGQSGDAAEQAQEAAGDMSRVSQQLNEAMMEMQQQLMQALRDALGRSAADALALARRQSELKAQMVGATDSELAALRADEAAIAQGVRNLAENYVADTEMAAPGSREFLTAAGEAMEQLDRTIEAMENRRTRSPSPVTQAEAVVRALNDMAQMAMSADEQSQGQGAAASSDQMMQQLQQLAQQQGEIIQDASSLVPMQMTPETMTRQMEQMADRQQEVAEELGELSESGTGEGEEPMPDPLGDLSAFAEEAQRLAEAMSSGRLDPEVLRRQERLFHRLLDAGRSLERDEESEERESEAPGDFEREEADALGIEDLDVLRFRLPGGEVLRALSPAQRALVLRYFERLNRRPAGPAGPAGSVGAEASGTDARPGSVP